MFIDPDNKRTRELLKWYGNTRDKAMNFNSVTGGVGPTTLSGISTTVGATGISIERPDNFKLADELI